MNLGKKKYGGEIKETISFLCSKIECSTPLFPSRLN